jgi:integral membrane sensor domain MASE1
MSHNFAAGRLGLAVPFTSANVSPVWPAAGMGMALVLIRGIRVSPAIALGAFLVNFFSPVPTLAAVGIGLGNANMIGAGNAEELYCYIVVVEFGA